MLSGNNNKRQKISHIQDFLYRIGLTQQFEQDTYLSLLRLGDATAANIITHSKGNRSQGYAVLKKLENLGLVSKYKSKGAVRYYAENPKKIKRLLEEQIIIFEETVAPRLSNILNTDQGSPQVRSFTGQAGARAIFEEALNCKEKIIYTMGSASDLKAVIGLNFAYTERRVAKGIQSKSLRVESEEFSANHFQDRTKNLQEIKWLPKNLLFDGYIIMWDNWACIIDTDHPESQHLLMQNSHSINLKRWFLWLWNNLK